jgi:hypothetical protein
VLLIAAALMVLLVGEGGLVRSPDVSDTSVTSVP